VLRRLYLLLSGVWALVFLANGATKEDGVGRGDVLLAIAPAATGWLLIRAGRFVVTGSPRPPSDTPAAGPPSRPLPEPASECAPPPHSPRLYLLSKF
jgi:hypothetical protein